MDDEDDASAAAVEEHSEGDERIEQRRGRGGGSDRDAGDLDAVKETSTKLSAGEAVVKEEEEGTRLPFVHYEIMQEQEGLIAGIKSPNVSGVQLDALIKSARGPEWNVVYSRALTKGTQDVFIAAQGPEKLDAVHAVARAGGIIKRSVWMVHGKVDDAALEALRRTHKNSTDTIHEVRVVRQFHSHSAQGGWLSILEAQWTAFHQAAIKASLQKIGHPVVGHGSSTARLRARGFRGNKLATCSLKFTLADGTCIDFSRVDEVLERYALLGMREEAAWETKTCKREQDFIQQGIDPKRARLLAEERDPISYHLDSDWKGFGVDISSDAVEATRANASSLGLADRCVLKQCDYAQFPDPFPEVQASGVLFSAVVCNPPYLPDRVSGTMAVLRNVPRAGYSGGEDGLDGYRAVASFFAQTSSVQEGAILALEVSGNFSKRHEQVKSLLQASGHLSYWRVGKPDHLQQQRCLLFRYTRSPSAAEAAAS
ncbi:Release factor glutamine methyltransferase [Hondaea fermentalgiana]|uniref:Release factor glutamine methyltransferase n=1 Tax=Hondaea fermentalgiana TaxID=2315210 RepID=A0A2R5GMU3_9STRA|nr:Release factor glutamine methyltransferase [Hondaea fermentalgiana]|eukprot:GBG31619.1 Release factor glutamine methyltransferase [Hondaea fermentalgiana]